MSTINSTQEAYEALCRGEFFQVGGVLINPDHVVKIDADREEPVFFLCDGSNVQHRVFGKGDVGDFLVEAIEKARREGRQSERLDPFRFAYQAENYELTRKKEDPGTRFSKAMRIPIGGTQLYQYTNNDNLRTYKLEEEESIVGADLETVTAQNNSPFGSTSGPFEIVVSGDERYIYGRDTNNDTLDMYEMSTPGDISTLSLVQTGVLAQDGAGDFVSPTFYVGAGNRNKVTFYELSTKWDLRTASQIDSQDLAPAQNGDIEHVLGAVLDKNQNIGIAYLSTNSSEGLTMTASKGTDASTLLPVDTSGFNNYSENLTSGGITFRNGGKRFFNTTNDILQFDLKE